MVCPHSLVSSTGLKLRRLQHDACRWFVPAMVGLYDAHYKIAGLVHCRGRLLQEWTGASHRSLWRRGAKEWQGSRSGKGAGLRGRRAREIEIGVTALRGA